MHFIHVQYIKTIVQKLHKSILKSGIRIEISVWQKTFFILQRYSGVVYMPLIEVGTVSISQVVSTKGFPIHNISCKGCKYKEREHTGTLEKSP